MIPALMPTYMRVDLAFERGEGAYLYTGDGRRYLDFGAGIAVAALGHCHPHMVAALGEQAASLWHCSNMYRIAGGERLARRLVEECFADSVFFTNSGTEAIECGLKMIRKYFDDAGQPERYRVICCEGSFHGRSLAAIAAAGKAAHLQGFAPAMDGFDHVAFANLNEMRAAITPETAAILIEPVQGEGGINPAPAEYLKALREIADEFGLLLFFDEVQCGMGRTGRLFAHEWAGIKPDIMALAKGLGGGFPVGACMATEAVASALGPGSHGSTYGGNPLAMAVGNAVLDIMLEDGFIENVHRIGEILFEKLQELVELHPGVLASVRGKGLMIGLECIGENKLLRSRLAENSMLVVNSGSNVIRLLPPLVIDENQVNEAIAILDKSCRELAGEEA